MRPPRLLPMIGIAVGGVLAIKALSGVTSAPELFQGAKAFAEGSVPAKTDPAAAKSSAPPLPPSFASGKSASTGAASAPLACGPNAADLARQAGLSPAELQILQSLQNRRGQLDTREQDMDAQMQLLAAAEAKIDAKMKALTGLKDELKGVISKADQERDAELARLVTVYAQMKPKDAAARMAMLDDSVRLPIAAKMKERALSAILGQMSPTDAKTLTEKLAKRMESKPLADARSAVAPPAAAKPSGKPAAKPAAAARPGASPSTKAG